ncbi:MAG: hypothetical protein U9O94_09100, partial [Nanoarchaeota archaeon]|nr:hypothetical protein [Nanoarchaeota archaeon]
GRFSLYVVDDNNNVLLSKTNESLDIDDEFALVSTQQVVCGRYVSNNLRWNLGKYKFVACPNSKIQNISYVKNRTVSSEDAAINLANYMYYAENANNMIGYKWSDLSAYNNIEIQEGYPLIYKARNSVMWSSSNSIRFKQSNQREFKEAHAKILPAPYFITTEYGNSVLEITRNEINRINLSGTPDEWAVDSNNFITEFANLGALSPAGWGVFRDRVFGHTESGFIMWSKEEMRTISNKRVKTATGYKEKPRIAVPKKTTLISFPNPLRNQYIWHDNEDHISYIYHIDQDAFTLFTGLNIIDADLIDKGDNLENLIMILDSNYDFHLYPDENNYYTGSAYMRTAGFPLDDNMIKKFIAKFEGDSSTIVVYAVNRSGVVTRAFVESETDAIKYIKNGAWGSHYYLSFGGDINKLLEIEPILQRRF